MRKFFTIPGIVVISVISTLVMILLAVCKCVDLTWTWVCDEWHS